MEMTRRHDRLQCLNSEQISWGDPPQILITRAIRHVDRMCTSRLFSIIVPCDVSASQDRSCSGDWKPACPVHGPVPVQPSGLFAHLSHFVDAFFFFFSVKPMSFCRFCNALTKALTDAHVCALLTCSLPSTVDTRKWTGKLERETRGKHEEQSGLLWLALNGGCGRTNLPLLTQTATGKLLMMAAFRSLHKPRTDIQRLPKKHLSVSVRISAEEQVLQA